MFIIMGIIESEKNCGHLILERGSKVCPIFEFLIFGRCIELLFFSQCFLFFFKLIVLKASCGMLTDFLYFLQFLRKLDQIFLFFIQF